MSAVSAVTMNPTTAFRRAQVYSFLAGAFLYPAENWTEDVPLVAEIVAALDFVQARLNVEPLALEQLRDAHRVAFGVTGSLCYETEYGLPHEFRQSQELADISGFYRAFGFVVGNSVRERPDHLAVELEFMHLLAIKEAYAAGNGSVAHVEICVEAQGKFLHDHLGGWIGLFAQSLALNAAGAYLALAEFAAAYVTADAARLGVTLTPRSLRDVRHTPPGPSLSCGECSLAQVSE